MIEVRSEQASDTEKIRNVYYLAFGHTEEGEIVDKLRKNCNETLSLVASTEGKIVGHIMFSPVILEAGKEKVSGMGLAPMAVLPEFQNRGIGSRLVIEGIKILKESDCPFIIVLGHEHYYLRFGFEPAKKYGIKCQWEGVPDNVFMVLILKEADIKEVSGTVKYRDEFSSAV